MMVTGIFGGTRMIGKLALQLACGLALIFVAVLPAHGDMRNAQVALKLKDYQLAFREFRESAELGLPMAQYNLAVLYGSGTGIERSNTQSYAWASLALENGYQRAKEIVDQLKPLLTPGSLRIAEDIAKPYRAAMLTEKLLPVFGDSGTSGLVGASIEKEASAVYPGLAAQDGIQGGVYVEMTIAADGHTRSPRIIYAVPPNIFDDTVRWSVMRTVFKPARRDGKPIAVLARRFYRFQMAEKVDPNQDLKRFLKTTEANAEAGDPAAQTLLGLVIAGLPQVNRPATDALPWFLKAAQAGEPLAQYQVGEHLLQGWGCRCEDNKALFWLQRAAAAGQGDAQVAIAAQLLKAGKNADSIASAMDWLERAVTSKNRDAKFYLAALLAAGPDIARHNPKRALQLVKEVSSDVDQDPTADEIRAAAYASMRDFSSAQKSENKAIKKATYLGWDLTQLHERASHYEQREAWSGNLFALQ
jgi:TonB family protein